VHQLDYGKVKVRKRITRGRKFKSSVYWSARGLTVEHTGTCEEIKNILTLREKEAVRISSDSNTQKMMKKT
jgi:hypothetical protein